MWKDVPLNKKMEIETTVEIILRHLQEEHSTLEKSLGVYYHLSYNLTLQLRGFCPKEMNTYAPSQKDLCMNIYNNYIHSTHKLAVTQMARQIVAHPQHSVLFSSKKITINMSSIDDSFLCVLWVKEARNKILHAAWFKL